MPLRMLAAAAAAAAAVLSASVAFAQPAPDDQIAAMVETWIAEGAADIDPVVRQYGIACVTPLLQGLDGTAKDVVIAAGGIEEGIERIEETDAAIYTALFTPLQQCIDTMFLGETIWPWVREIEAARPPGEQEAAAFCVMDAIRPLPTGQKQTLYLAAVAPGADFEDGLDALVIAEPELEEMLELAIEPCV